MQEESRMTITIPVTEDSGLSSKISDHFGSAPFFAMVDLESNTVACVGNPNAEHVHGRCMPVDFLREKGVSAVVCRGMGRGALSRLTEAGIACHVTEAETGAKAVESFRSGRTTVMTADSACHGHGCH
jgi:predicted Fe-Mo cluster-binding NifX family protein